MERGLDTVAFLQELVRVPSLSGREPAQRLVEERLRELGFDVRSVDRARSSSPRRRTAAFRSSPTRPALPRGDAGRRIGRSSPNGHVDVVSEAPAERWTRPPFGRRSTAGACTAGRLRMKGGIAAMLLAVEAALAVGPARPGRLPERDRGGGGERRGRRLAGPSADGVVIAEPTNGGFDVVAVGVIWARLTFEASAASVGRRGLEPDRDRVHRTSRRCAGSRPS